METKLDAVGVVRIYLPGSPNTVGLSLPNATLQQLFEAATHLGIDTTSILPYEVNLTNFKSRKDMLIKMITNHFV
jgi:hypothetical protein